MAPGLEKAPCPILHAEVAHLVAQSGHARFLPGVTPSIARLADIRAKASPEAAYGSLPVWLLCRLSCFQLDAFVLALVATLCASAGVQWMVWYVDNIVGISSPGLVGIGLWGTCSLHRVTIKKINVVCTALADHESFPSEMIIDQGFMPLASIANVLSFLDALYNVFKPRKHKGFIFTLFPPPLLEPFWT